MQKRNQLQLFSVNFKPRSSPRPSDVNYLNLWTMYLLDYKDLRREYHKERVALNWWGFLSESGPLLGHKFAIRQTQSISATLFMMVRQVIFEGQPFGPFYNSFTIQQEPVWGCNCSSMCLDLPPRSAPKEPFGRHFNQHNHYKAQYQFSDRRFFSNLNFICQLETKFS